MSGSNPAKYQYQVSIGIGFGLPEEVGRLPRWTRDRELGLEEGRPYVDVLGRSTGLEKPHLQPGDFVKMASELLNVRVDQLASKRQDSATARLRRMVASCGIERWGQRAGKLAEVLNKHTVVIGRWVSEGRQLREEDREFSVAFEALDKAFSEKTIEQLGRSGRTTMQGGTKRGAEQD